MTIEIQKNIARPGTKGGEITEALRACEIDDSFFIQKESAPLYTIINRINAMRPRKFLRRSLKEGGIDGFRIWRIA